MAESVDPDHAAHAWFAERNQRVREEISAGVAQAQRVGQVRVDLNPADVAAQLIAMLDGLVLQWALDEHKVDAVAAMRSFALALRA